MKALKSMTTAFIFTIIFNINAQTPQILWWFDTDDSAFGQTAMGDINCDGNLNLVFGCYRNDSMIYALNATDGSLLWKFNASGYGEGCNDVAALIYDVDGDGFMDVVVPASCNPKTFCFNGATGAVKWIAPTRGSDSPPTIADLNGDGQLEILHGEFGGYVICINANDGSIKWEILVSPNSWIQTAPTIVDLDGNGQLDFVVATWHFYDDNKLYAFRGDDQSLMWELPLNDVVYHGTAVADLTQDGKPELILGDYSGTLYVVKGETGDTLWTFNSGSYIGSPVSVGDLNGDGRCEIIFTSWYKVFALKYDGSVLWQYNIPSYEQSFRGVALSDIDNDSLPDVIFGTSGGKLMALKGTTGNPLWSIDLAQHLGDELNIDHAPVVGDFNKNGILDVFVVGGKTEYPDFSNNYGRAYAVEVGTGAGPEWPMFQFDHYRTGNLCHIQHTASVKKPLNKNLSNLKLFPNPVNQGERLYIDFDFNKFESHIHITDITGRTVLQTKLRDNYMTIPHHIKPGLYFFNIEGRGGAATTKIIVL